MQFNLAKKINVVAALAASCLLSTMASADAQSAFEIDRNIVYSKVGDTELKLDAYVPNRKGPHPAVLVVHGGAWRSGNKLQLAGYARNLAERGFAAFAIDYRLAPKHKWPAQIEDCRAAVRWIRANAKKYNVDPFRLGAVGYSAGGHLVSLLGTTGKAPGQETGNHDLRVQAVVAGGAPVDFRLMPKNSKVFTYWLGGTRAEVPERYIEASPNAFVTADSAPTFQFNGTKDSLVRPAFSRPLHESLKRAGVVTEFHELEGANHLTAAMNQAVLDKAWAFFETHLQLKDTQSVGK